MGICIPQSLKEEIDLQRGDIPRSKYISKILESMLGANLGANQYRPLLILSQPSNARVVQVDKHQYDTDESKVFRSVCYMKGCNKVATTPAGLIINKKLELVIYVCNSCLPRISVDVTSKMGGQIVSFRSNSYGMTKKYGGFGRSDLRGGTRDRLLIIPLETARKCGLDKPSDVIVEDTHNSQRNSGCR